MRGRKPQPKALKLLRGTRSDRVNDREPVYCGDLVAPTYVHASGRELWDRLVALLEPAGVVTAGDWAGLVVLCSCWELWRSNPGNVAARKDVIRLLVEFGLTPSSRTKVSGTVNPMDDLERFLG